MKPTPRHGPVTLGDFSRADGVRHPHHPRSYELSDPEEIREYRAAHPPHADDRDTDGFDCMCDEGWGSPAPTAEAVRLLDPFSPDGFPARHRSRWTAAAPRELRAYARALADGQEEPPGPRGVPLSVLFRWLGTVREQPRDAARLLADRAPGLLLARAATADLAWAVRETDRVGLEGAVRFFAGEGFTTRHPKRRRVPDTARDLLLRHARSHRPSDLPVLERRLLRDPEDRLRRS
ncbi:hypothetical protein ACFWUZ_09740 [Streptomyces sp. NPDC058646]|uniref:hypothetical protein n=1 Tax=Streptomyces sp. NPDC058646 TaxID=3346574 RepID=UPI00365C9E60